MPMSDGSNVSVLYREFADALTEVLAENAGGPVRRGRLARARPPSNTTPTIARRGIFMQSKLRVLSQSPLRSLPQRPWMATKAAEACGHYGRAFANGRPRSLGATATCTRFD